MLGDQLGDDDDWESNPKVAEQMEIIKKSPDYQQAILLLRQVWDQWAQSQTDQKLIQDVWLEYTDILDVVRGEM